ncbi:GspE/PulE family protein [Synechococcus sp. MVIR-18-1]|uniref:GspE/PulE family protein n=1 Tax=Synechococcus sp. MVIR-18-1 TaxID=1386941 RepID=UPI0018614B2D|nr:GspE/PulE family protein [Synechococcus sp. MVIR-18-1]QNI75037.1 type II secretory pathway/ ATPase PulE/Tfp pilus assembly pathway/ ATPase PilB [Synechococcus sp. MVIR-18-1]
MSADSTRMPLPPALPEKLISEAELAAGEAILQSGQVLDLETWKQLQALPIHLTDDGLIVAIASSSDKDSREQLKQVLRSHGYASKLVLANAAHLKRILDPQEFNSDSTISQTSIIETAKSLLDGFDTEGIFNADPDEAEIQSNSASSLDINPSIAGGSPIVTLVDRILVKALDMNASDIHVEPQQAGLQIRLRKDGVLTNLTQPLPTKLIPAITSRFKIMADLDIAERRQAQDGRIRRQYKGRTVDFRVNSLPSRYGEKICLRLLDSQSTQLGLDKLISNPNTLELVRTLGSKPFGMILVTGPTGSGKSTTLYSLLAERNEPGINISTVEDPIEYTLPGITQCQVNREKGFDFSTALRAFMRQDPDVLLVGETRDQETAKTAIEAALTGHLVLTTLHCNDAPSAIARLDEMGVEPFMVSASLLGIVSQRLLRRVCSDCRIPYHPDSQELGRFGLMTSHEGDVTFFKAKQHEGPTTPCPNCQGTGYKGRIGVYEVLRMNEALAASVAKGATTDLVRQLALEAGMKTLLGYSLDLVREGHTTLEEVDRMVLTDAGLESEQRARALNTVTCRGCGGGLHEGWLECPYCLTPRQ